jgi:hypothetical protein
MILPGTYQNGFAPRDGEPLFPELWDGCVGAWNPGLGPSGLTLRDWSPYENHGTLTNMDPGSDWVTNRGEHALDFDGINDEVLIGNIQRFQFAHNQPFSLSVRFIPGNNAFNPIVQFSTESGSGGPSGYYIHHVRDAVSDVLANSVIAEYFNGGTPTINSAQGRRSAVNSVLPGQLVHVAMTRDGSASQVGHRMYLNGTEVTTSRAGAQSATITTGVVYSAAQFSIGRRLGAGFANMQCCDCCVHNRALSSNEIRLLASHRGIAYEMAPRGWTQSQIAAYRARYYSQLIGGGVI